jgi:hypothetical protein
LGAELARDAGAHMLDERAGIARDRQGLGDAFEDRAEVADRDALGQQQLQHALNAGN